MKNLIQLIVIGLALFIALYSANFTTHILLTGSDNEIILTLAAIISIAIFSGYNLFRFLKRG